MSMCAVVTVKQEIIVTCGADSDLRKDGSVQKKETWATCYWQIHKVILCWVTVFHWLLNFLTEMHCYFC